MSVWVCETYVVHHLVSTGLRCAPSTGVVHNFFPTVQPLKKIGSKGEMGYLFFWPNGVDAGGTWTLRHFHFIIRLGLFWSREALRTRNLNVEEMKLYLAMQSFLSQAS